MTEYTVRAAGADSSLKQFILGKFPGAPPNLRGPGPWRLSRNEQDAKEWMLQGGEDDDDDEENDTNSSIVEKYRGVPDAGITGTSGPSNYFILIKEKGTEGLVAIPVDEWATFKSIQRRSQLSLEDAEAQMKFRRLQAERANPNIAQAIGDEDVEAGGLAAPTGGTPAPNAENEPDSDDEWKDIQARAASLATIKKNNTAIRRNVSIKNEDNDAVNDAEALGVDGAVYVPKPADAEDWEHEGEAADDDLDMGGGSDADVDLSPGRTPKSNEGSDSDGDGEDDIDAMKKAIRRMMKGTGAGGSDESEDVSEIEEDDDDLDGLDDLDDLDRMASEVLPKAGGGGDGGGKKRKSPAPAEEGAMKGFTPVSRAVEDAEIMATAAKKARIAASVPSPPVSPTAHTGPPTEEEVIALLKAHGGMLLKDLSLAFTKRLKTKEEKGDFAKLIKKVGKLSTDEQGSKFVVLK